MSSLPLLTPGKYMFCQVEFKQADADFSFFYVSFF
jgi:hypothetical protein